MGTAYWCRTSAAAAQRASAIPRVLGWRSRRQSGKTLIDFAEALALPRFAVAGYDWGNRAACIAAALHPDRVRAAVFIGGYTIQDTMSPPQPLAPERERALWYQWYFNTERGRLGLAANRRPLCKLLWQLWSPTWHFTDGTYNRTAPSFDNPDFVDCVIHSYRHRNLGRPASHGSRRWRNGWQCVRRSMFRRSCSMALTMAWDRRRRIHRRSARRSRR
jgi:pimeloyl-ACP methyl ester carboxylesterase